MADYGYRRTLPVAKAMVDWGRTRTESLALAMLYAAGHDWPPPPERGHTLVVTFAHWEQHDGCSVRRRCAPSQAEEVDLTVKWKGDPEEWAREMARARAAKRTQVLVIDTTHHRVTREGGCWWEVGIPEVSERPQVNKAHAGLLEAKTKQRV